MSETVTTASDLPQQIAGALDAPRRDRVSRSQMSPEMSYGRHAGPAPTTARAAAVIILLFRRDDRSGGAERWHLPLIERPATLTRHGGQISLPGGVVEPGESSSDAARRELQEELGIDAAVEILGRLADCYVFASDFVITPWVAVTRGEPRWQPHDREVQRVVELSLDMLLSGGLIGRMTIERGPLQFHAPCYQIGNACIWGATSVILSELAQTLRSIS